ncbi:MAG: hypothetical protein KAS32_28025 [Candidatus Peribacteraceae bacterium]|nr:hypothetical protein [Candidatus Peribacteraceae bacterium]
MGKKKTYIAYAIYDIELGCGCMECGYIHVFNHSGEYKKFDDYEEAVSAAKSMMVKEDCDRWNVI